MANQYPAYSSFGGRTISESGTDERSAVRNQFNQLMQKFMMNGIDENLARTLASSQMGMNMASEWQAAANAGTAGPQLGAQMRSRFIAPALESTPAPGSAASDPMVSVRMLDPVTDQITEVMVPQSQANQYYGAGNTAAAGDPRIATQGRGGAEVTGAGRGGLTKNPLAGSTGFGEYSEIAPPPATPVGGFGEYSQVNPNGGFQSAGGFGEYSQVNPNAISSQPTGTAGPGGFGEYSEVNPNITYTDPLSGETVVQGRGGADTTGAGRGQTITTQGRGGAQVRAQYQGDEEQAAMRGTTGGTAGTANYSTPAPIVGATGFGEPEWQIQPDVTLGDDRSRGGWPNVTQGRGGAQVSPQFMGDAEQQAMRGTTYGTAGANRYVAPAPAAPAIPMAGPQTGTPWPNIQIDPNTGRPIMTDPATGQQFYIDPMTGQPIAPVGPKPVRGFNPFRQ